MLIRFLLKCVGFRMKSQAEKINDRVIAGYEPSALSKAVVGQLSSDEINKLMGKAVDQYNRKHGKRLFAD